MNNRLSQTISRRKGQHCVRGTVSPSNAALLSISCIRQAACVQSSALEGSLLHFTGARLEEQSGKGRVYASFPSTHTCHAWNG